MPDVRMPDGAVVRFPDTMSPEEIKGIIATKFPEVAPAKEAAAPERGGFRRVDDFMRGAADMTSFGFADEIAAGANALIGNGDYASNVAAERARDAEGGWERLAGQIGGAFLMPGKAAASIGSAALKGMGGGALYGFGSGEGDFQERLPSAAVGAAFGGAAGGALRAGTNALQKRAAQKAIPSVGQIRNVAEAGYKAADDAGVIVKPDGMRRFGTEVVNDLANLGYHPRNEPRISAILEEVERLGNTNTSYKGLQVLNRIIGNAAGSTVPSERKMAMQIKNRLESYMRNIPGEDVITGNAQAASRGFQQGQDNWARMRRAEMVDTAKVKAERRAASTGTGGNLENAMRQNVRGILDNPRRSRGMTPEELVMANKVVMGTPGQNLLRQVGKLSPTTGGLQGLATLGATMLNPMFAIPAGVGFAAKAAAEGMTTRNFNHLSQMIRSGGRTANDLVALAKGGTLNLPQVRRLENLAKLLGVPLPQLSAVAGSLLEKQAVNN